MTEKRTIHAFTISRPDSLDPHSVVADANRQAMAEAAVSEVRAQYAIPELDFHYARADDHIDLEVWSTDPDVLHHVAALLEERYGEGVEIESRQVSG